MILLFPNLDTFRLALTSGIVPPEMSLAPAVVSHDAAGRIFVETTATLAKKGKAELDKLKVLGSKRHGGDAERVASWLQVLPLTADKAPPPLSSQAPVLFELSSAELLPTLVGEMLRLGNDRQSYRMLTDAGDSRVLLRVIGPPYYTLLRAVDKLAVGGGTVRAYTEQAPRVWVELGYSHPFAKQIKLDDGQLVLIRHPRQWAYLPDAGFQDVYDILNFTLPTTESEWAEAPAADKITVPLRLVPGNAADQAEMWVLRGEGVAQLDAMVRDADDRLTEQLRFAVGGSPTGEQTVVIGVARSKKDLPVLALDHAVAFKSYWRIPNLFLPVGTRLHPTVRRDVVTKLLAENRDKRVWLFPGPDGTFVPEAIAENAFRSLGGWVDYVIDANAADLREWIASTEFDFDRFVCPDSGGPKPKPDRDKPDREKRDKDEKDAPPAKATTPKAGGKKATAAEITAFVGAAVAKPPSEWKIRCDELEREFRELEGPLDMPERQALWPQLAVANAGMGEDRRGESAICWVNSLWGQASPAAELIDGWANSETPTAPRTAAEFDARLAAKSPTPSQVRAAVSLFLSLAQQPPDWLRSRLPAVQKFLEDQEAKLPIRGVWLAAVRLAQLAGGDVLGLARVRDRLLNRLLERGLSPEQDLPTFLRFAGLKNSERVRVVRERTAEVHQAARAWTEASLKAGSGLPSQADSVASTLAYVDLMFAFGLAKLGETTHAQRLVEDAKQRLTGLKAADKSIVAGYLFKVFQYRIDDALAGKPNIGPLSRELLDDLEAISKQGGKAANDPHKLAYYVINRMRQQSEIVEPQEKNDPYADWMKLDDLKKELADLPRLKDANALGKRMLDLFKNGVKGTATAETRFAVLHDVLHLAPRVGQDFAVEMVKQVPGVFKDIPAASANSEDQAKKEAELLERALFLAAHYDKTDLVQTLVDQFIAHVHKKPDEQRFLPVNMVASRSLKSLRKVGLREEIDKFLRRMQDEILKGKTLGQLKTLYATKPDVWAEALQTMLNLAAGWLTFGLTDQASPILEAGRQEMLTGQMKISVQKFASLCRTYIAAVGQGPADVGMPKLVELFKKLDPPRVTNTFTSAPYYSRLHLNVVESAVLAIVSDDFALGHAGKRWLDEDEQLVRKRVHGDMRAMVQRTGV